MTRSLAALLLVACSSGAPPAKTSTAVRIRAVERAAAAGAARYSATINPAARVDVAFKVGGYIEGVARITGVDGKPRALQAGDRVVRGQELASVRRADYQQKLAEARAGAAEAAAAYEQARMDHERSQTLLASKTIGQAQADSARVALDAAQARVAGARVRVEEAQMALADTTLRSPMDGVVLARNVEVGALAGLGTIAFSIADTSTVKVVFGVPDTVLASLQLGASQAVSTESLRGEAPVGRITRIAPVADPQSRVFEVEITLDNAAGDLRAGVVASLKLGGNAEAPPVAVLPLSAIVRSAARKDAFAVFVVEAAGDKQVARLREVELGEFLGNQIPIKKGLADGENVVVMGASLLSDGESVLVIP